MKTAIFSQLVRYQCTTLLNAQPKNACLLNIRSISFTHTLRLDVKKEPDKKKMSNTERTFIAIKPDGVQRGLVGKIICRFEEKGFKLVAMKMEHATTEHLQKHYADLKTKPFFKGLVTYMSSGPLVAMVWEGLDAVKTGRRMLGETDPAKSAPGTIRGDYCIQVGRNICHGSDSVESAQKEIALWFKENELCDYSSCAESWIYE